MGSTYSHLSLGERREIEEMLNAGLPVTRIAAERGRHRSTVHREVGRNFHHTAAGAGRRTLSKLLAGGGSWPRPVRVALVGMVPAPAPGAAGNQLLDIRHRTGGAARQQAGRHRRRQQPKRPPPYRAGRGWRTVTGEHGRKQRHREVSGQMFSVVQ